MIERGPDGGLSVEPAKAIGFLARLAANFTAVLSLPDLLDHVLRVLHDETGFHSCSLAVPDPHNPEALIVRAASGLRQSFRGLGIPAGEGLHGTVMTTGTPLLIPDMHSDPRVFRRDPDIKSGIYAPLTVQGRQIGVLSAHRNVVNGFCETELGLLTVVAGYLAGAIEVARLYEELKELATTDALTGLANRRFFLDRLESEIARSRRACSCVSIVLLDLNGFKSINDSYGHARGDEILRRVGQRLRRLLRNSDVAARFGGDEFTLILPDTVRAQIDRIIGRLGEENIGPQDQGDVDVRPVTFAWGIAIFPEDGPNCAQLLQVADARLYAMKHLKGGTRSHDARGGGC